MIEIYGEDITMGRSNFCEVRVPHLTCSSRHFRIYSTVFDEHSDPLVFCEDLNSTNGTFVNGKMVEPGGSVLLCNGDKIEIMQAAEFEFEGTETLSNLDELSKKDHRLFGGTYTLTSRFLGAGGFASVYMALENKNRQQVACKVVELKLFAAQAGNNLAKEKVEKMAMREVEILAGLSHPNIINIHRVFKTSSRIYIFEELIAHGDLFSFMVKKGVLKEVEAYSIIWQILIALNYLHGKGVVHRDLKPENILCGSRETGGRVILTDFGTARFFTAATRMTTNIGTKEFSAPEVYRSPSKGYSKAVDLWSVGVITHNLISGQSLYPEDESSQTKVPNDRHAAAISQIESYTHISQDAKDFIIRLHCLDARKRMTAKQAMEHSWLSRHKNELNGLYDRATRHCRGRTGPALIESFETSKIDENPNSLLLDDDEMDDLPELVRDNYSPPSLRELSFPNMKVQNKYGPHDEIPESSWEGVNHESRSQDQIINDREQQTLYDSVVGDGRLRNAAELLREVNEDRRRRRRMVADNLFDDEQDNENDDLTATDWDLADSLSD